MNADYSYEDIVKALLDVGLKTGDNVFVHSNIGFFGRMKDGNTPEDYCRSFKEAIFEVIGEEGTLIVPTFSYSFCWGQDFDPSKTPGICGIFSESIRKDPDSFRSSDANFSICAIGKNAEYFCSFSPEHSFGDGSFWEKFLKLNGIICNFNFDSGSTFIHYIEKLFRVPYRYDKLFIGKLIGENNSIEKTYYHFVYDYDHPEFAPNFENFHRIAVLENIVNESNLGKGKIVSVSSSDVLRIFEKFYSINNYVFTKKYLVLPDGSVEVSKM